MDPNGGVNPSSPRLDTASPQTAAPAAPTAPILESAPNPAPVQLPENQPTVPPLVPQPKSDKGMLKKILFIVLAIIVVLGLSAGTYFVGLTSGKAKGRTEADADYQRREARAQQEAAEDEEAEADQTAELQLGDLKAPVYEDETVEAGIGKQVSAGDGLVLKVVNIERNFKTTDTNYKLDNSKELIKVNFLVGNVANDKPKDISNFNFKLEDSSGALLTPENVADYKNKFDTLKLDQGAQSEASIVYKVNKNETPLKFVREQRYRITTENREVTTRIVITLAK